MEFFTIGVFHSTERAFFEKLTNNKIDTFCDVRQLRGIRGTKYSFANSSKLREKLKELNIKYSYAVGLTPTQEVRDLQKLADKVNRVSITNRRQLDQAFIQHYKEKILDKFDFDTYLEYLNKMGSKRIVLFCVEEFAKACHRSLITKVLKEIRA